MEPFFKVYIAAWSAACLAALVLAWRRGPAQLPALPGRGVILSFVGEGWPGRPVASAPWRLAIYAAALAPPAIAGILIFFI